MTSESEETRGSPHMLAFVLSGLFLFLVVFLLRDNILEPLGLIEKRLSLVEGLFWAVVVLSGTGLVSTRGQGIARQFVQFWPRIPPQLRAVLLAVLWVLLNLGLVSRALRNPERADTWLIMAGVLNGALVALPVVTFASARVRAGLTAFVSGIALDNVGASDTALQRVAAVLVLQVQNLATFLVRLLSLGEAAATEIQSAIQSAVWTAIAVVVLTIVWDWITNLRSAPRLAASPNA